MSFKTHSLIREKYRFLRSEQKQKLLIILLNQHARLFFSLRELTKGKVFIEAPEMKIEKKIQ